MFSHVSISPVSFSNISLLFDGGGSTPTERPGIYPRGLGGGGTGIDYQVPRAARTMSDSPDRHAKRITAMTELEVAFRTLVGETASMRMQREARELSDAFKDAKDEIDFSAWQDDTDARDALMAVHKRYSDKRVEMFKKLREQDYDWEE